MQSNLIQAMWRAEALRQRLGNQPLTVTSGFRSSRCDASVGGASTGKHTYGRRSTVGSAGNFNLLPDRPGGPLDRVQRDVRPGYPDHYDHVHGDIRSGRSWSAPNCGVTS